MILNDFLTHLNKFIMNEDISIQWAKESETFLDLIEEKKPEAFNELEDVFELLQEKLSLYRPGGGEYLIDECEMRATIKKVICRITIPKSSHKKRN